MLFETQGSYETHDCDIWLELDAVSFAIEVLEGVAIACENATFPWLDVLFVECANEVAWVNVEVFADMRVLRPLAPLIATQ